MQLDVSAVTDWYKFVNTLSFHIYLIADREEQWWADTKEPEGLCALCLLGSEFPINSLEFINCIIHIASISVNICIFQVKGVFKISN